MKIVTEREMIVAAIRHVVDGWSGPCLLQPVAARLAALDPETATAQQVIDAGCWFDPRTYCNERSEVAVPALELPASGYEDPECCLCMPCARKIADFIAGQP